MDKKSYIKEHSWSGFKSGIKYSSYVYLGATIASLLISLAVVPIFPFTLLIFNPVVWAMLGVAFVGLSGAAMSIASPLFHWAKDSINQRKAERKKGKAISNCRTSDDKLGTPSGNIVITDRVYNSDKENYVLSVLESSILASGFMEKTNPKDYQYWLDYSDIVYIAYDAYGYLPSQIKNDVYFFVCKPELVSGRIPDSKLEPDQKGRFFSNGKLLTDRGLAFRTQRL